jgi:hypothetical protein
MRSESSPETQTLTFIVLGAWNRTTSLSKHSRNVRRLRFEPDLQEKQKRVEKYTGIPFKKEKPMRSFVFVLFCCLSLLSCSTFDTSGGEKMISDSSARETELQTCYSSEVCSAGETCQDGYCLPPSNCGCLDDYNCPAGETCKDCLCTK